MIAYTFTGEEERSRDGRYIMPQNVTHVSIHPSIKIIPAWLFQHHQNIVELICHDGVERIERYAFYRCPSLRRVIMRGVRVVGWYAFFDCNVLEYVECPKLERIGGEAFRICKSLSNINLPSAKEVETGAFEGCHAMVDVKFGEELESFRRGSFSECRSLERITFPLKNDLVTRDDTFQACDNLKRVDLVERAVLHDTVAALLLEEWRDDMTAEIDSINHILPNARAGYYHDEYDFDAGEKALVIREWIERVLYKIISYKAQHRLILSEAASALQLTLPNDIVTNHVVPFLELPLHLFDGEDDEDDDEEENINDSDDDNEYTSDEDEDRDGEEEDASFDGEADKEQQQHDGDEGGRKRRKTTSNGNEESDG